MEQRQSPARHRGPAAKTRSRLTPLCAATVLALTAACSSGREDSQYWNFGADGWPYADTLVHQAADSACVADIAVVVRHAADYEYSNLRVALAYPADSGVTLVDTFNIVLADDFGRWHGHGLGVGLQYADTLLRSVRLPDSARLCLRHVMQADTLGGIEQVGIVLNYK